MKLRGNQFLEMNFKSIKAKLVEFFTSVDFARL